MKRTNFEQSDATIRATNTVLRAMHSGKPFTLATLTERARSTKVFPLVMAELKAQRLTVERDCETHSGALENVYRAR